MPLHRSDAGRHRRDTRRLRRGGCTGRPGLSGEVLDGGGRPQMRYSPVMTDADQPRREEDPRRQRSRSRLLDAASNLLSTGGVDAVTIEAVTRASKVARTTLYRHFPDSTALITAAFERLLPPLPPLAETGPLRTRLIEVLDHITASVQDAPLHTTILGWLALGPGRGAEDLDDRIDSLRQRVIDHYVAPVSPIFADPAVRAEIGEVDPTTAMLRLAGPLVFARLAGLPVPDAEVRAELIDDFLDGRRRRIRGVDR